MRFGICILLCVLAFPARGVCAETIVLKTGEELDAAEIIPAGKVLRVKLESEWREIKRKELTPEQTARYFTSGYGMYYSFTTVKVAGNTEYTYYYNGKYAGMRLIDADGLTLRYVGSMPDGIYREYYPGDAVRNEQPVTGNLRNGPSRSYFKDGGLREETWFLDDVPHGLHRIFDPAGNLLSEERFIHGKREAEMLVSPDRSQQAKK